MNKYLFRVIFNKKRGIMMAVQENAHSQGKASQNGSVAVGAAGNPLMRLASLAVAVAALFGGITIVNAQIVSDPNAGARRPTVDTTANGRPLVQITAPSAAGVSHNQYSQFNVGTTGAILNNATNVTQTQLGGYVAGNPNLPAGGARVILNEVTGTSPSHLLGYTEVAGQRAEVIIANPNGITCSGCGFINTSRGMLTTGTPVFGGDGSLDAFRVSGGQIVIGAGGLNAANTDQLDLISRSVKVNGELWGTNVNVITGANLVNYANLGVQVIQGDADKPTVGIDVSNLGGMYANKIRLVGTEAGVGVVSAGTIAAQASDLIIDNQGRITLTGSTNAAGNLTITNNDDVANSGTVYAQQNVQITSTGAVTNTGFVGAQNNLNVAAASVNSTAILGAGVGANGAVTPSGSLTITASGEVTATGQNLAGSNMALTGASINLANSTTSAGGTASLTATAGDVDNTSGLLQVAGGLTVSASGAIKNDSAQISASQLTANAASLSNQGGTIRQSGAGNTAITTSGAIDNASGMIVTNAQDLAIQSGSLNNTQGAINHAGAGTATINTGALNNTGGAIATNGLANITATSVANQSGVISAQQQASITSQTGIDNSALNGTGGYIGADSLTITASGQINNAGGTVEAIQGITVNSLSLNNAAGRIQNLGTADTTITTTNVLSNTAVNGIGGFIGGNGKLTLTAGSLDNTSSTLQSNGALSIQSNGVLTNQSGVIQTEDNLTVVATGALNNAGGRIEANGTTATALVTAAGIDNTAGRIANKGTGLTTINGGSHITNANAANAAGMGIIGGNGNVQVNSTNLSNTQNAQVLAGGNLTLGTATILDNGGGTIYAVGDVTLNQAGVQINNTGGNIGALGNIGITGASLNNTSGQIASTVGSGSNVALALSGNLTNTGGMVAADLDLTLSANTLIGNGQVVAGQDATVSLQGNYTNGTGNQLAANRDLTLSATGNLTNAGTLEAGRGVTVSGANIDNQNAGLINGQMTVVKATNAIINTGRIYGDDIAIGAAQFSNDTANGQAGVVAARNTLNIGAATVINREHAWLYSEGDMTIARTLGSDNKATGAADTVTNSSARIETDSNGSLTIDATSIINTNAHFSTSQLQTDQSAHTDYQGSGSANRYDESLVQNSTCIDGIDCKIMPDGTFLDYTIRNYTRTTTNTFVTESAPAEILVGKNMHFSSSVVNDKSRIVVGGSLTGNSVTILNIDAEGQNIMTDVGTAQYTWTEWHGNKNGRSRHSSAPVAMADAPIVTPTQLGIVSSQIQTTFVKNADPAAGQGVGLMTIAGAAGKVLDPNQTSQKAQIVGLSQTVAIAGTTSPVFTLPNNALFQIHAEPNQLYLIETDPKYANYRNFLSSDYMLSRLSMDPQGVQKRLGDGFYEQKLINDQITQMTGRRYLSGYTSAENEFKDLMDAGIASATAFNLVPGVTLSDAQIAALTHDIVWMVEQTIALPNGTSQRVLAPVVYLTRAHTQDLKPSGAIISAESIDLKVGGTLQNSGTLQAGSRLVIDALDIENRGGRIASNSADGTTTLIASNNVLNQGGAISGHRVGIVAGNDVVLQTLAINTSGLTGTRTAIGRVASIDADSLSVQAGRDMDMTAAKVTTTVDTTLVAGRDVNLKAITTHVSENLVFDAKNSLRQSHSDVVGSQVQSGGNAILQAGQDIKATASDVNAGGNLTAFAGRDITLDAAQKTNSFSQEVSIESKGFLSSSSRHSVDSMQSSDAVGTNLSGDNVTLQANRNVGITGSTVTGNRDVNLGAVTGNIVIGAAQNSASELHRLEESHSGFTAGYQAGVASVGHTTSNSAGLYTLDETSQQGSSISSANGSVRIQAAQTLTLAASDLSAADQLALTAKSIDLIAAQNTSVEHSEQQSSSHGFAVGVTVNPYAAYKNGYNDSAKGNQTTSAIGKTLKRDEARAEGVTAATTAVTLQAHSRSFSSTEDNTTSAAKVSTLTAGGDLTIIATDNSINSQGTDIRAEGNVTLLAKTDLNLDVAHTTETQSQSSQGHGWSVDNRSSLPVGKFNNKSSGNGNADTIAGTTLSIGGNATLGTTDGNINITAGNVVATGDTNISAARDLTIQSGQNTFNNTNHSSNKAIGKVVISDTERFAGYHTEKHNDNSEGVTQINANVASLGGNVTLTAGDQYTQSTSNILAGKDVAITAKSIDITAASNTGSQAQDEDTLKVGLFARISSPLIDLANNLHAARESDGRLKDMQNMAAAANAYQAVSAATSTSGALIKGEVGIGIATSDSKDQSSFNQAQASTIKGGNNVNLTTTEGDLRVTGSSVTAGKALTLDSAKDLVLQSAQSKASSEGDNHSAGIEAGVGFSVGAQTGVYAYVAASYGEGEYKNTATIHNNTHLVGDSVTLKSQGDTTLKGADVKADTITADVKGKLAIESEQDTVSQHNEQSNVGVRVQVSFGTAWEVSGSMSQASGDSNAAYVNEQSGLFAGNGGYHINADTVDLTGAAITSTNAANSQLTTNALTFKNLENKMDYKAGSVSLAGSISGGSGEGDTNKDGTSKPEAQQQTFGSTKSGNVTPGLPLQEKGGAHSTTYATLTDGAITIGGKTTNSAKDLGINTDASTAHTVIVTAPDIKKVMKEQQAMSAAAGTVIATSKQIANDITINAGKTQKAAQKVIDDPASSDEDKAQAQQTIASTQQTQRDWGVGGKYSLALAVATGLTVDGVASGKTGAATANAVGAVIDKRIGDLAKENDWIEGSTEKTILHGIAGLIQAKLGGTDALSGATAGAVKEALTPAMESLLESQGYERNTPAFNDMMKLGSVLVGAAAGAAVGGNGQSINAGANIALNAEIYNRQLHPDETKWIKDNAKRFAARHPGMTETEAETRLAQQAFRQVQYGAPGAVDAEAMAFLSQAHAMLPADPSCPTCGPGTMFYANPEQKANGNMYASTLPQTADFYQKNGLKQPTLQQIVDGANKAGQDITFAKSLTKVAPIAAAGLVLAPAFASVAAEVAAFTKNPVGYCLTNPIACTVSAETVGYTAAGVPQPGSLVPTGAGSVALAETRTMLTQEVGTLRAALTGSAKTGGNMGVAEINIPGIQTTMAASSRIANPSAEQQALGFVGQVPETFASSIVPTGSNPPAMINRVVDSEAKILNNIAAKLGDNTAATGTITLLTERAPCASCSNVIEQFQAKYPNIKITVLDNGGANILPTKKGP